MRVITQAAGHAASFPLWGDVPTWALAVLALAALIAAVLAYFKQADAARDLARQANLQGEQLEDQRQANAKQAEVLDAQLREFQQRERIIERQQADNIELKQSTLTSLGGARPRGERSYQAEVINRSPRPIMEVTCRIEPAAGEGLQEAWSVSHVGEGGMQAPGFLMPGGQVQGSGLRFMRSGETWVFTFRPDAARYPNARITLRFTDDAGLHWQITPNLHLEKLDNRDDW